jgi:hypothetical protein
MLGCWLNGNEHFLSEAALQANRNFANQEFKQNPPDTRDQRRPMKR